ncbi:hypothetical protein, partial [uncultured Parabacteroides sp.]|uniref:hypothetical protein n=1 Tax=uncultured Parabacteroides sp. TaxID=512312 RepID=UPI0025F1A0A3
LCDNNITTGEEGRADPAPTAEPACSIVTAPVRAVREPPLPTTLHSNLSRSESNNKFKTILECFVSLEPEKVANPVEVC